MRSRPQAVVGIGGALAHDGNAALLVDGELVASSQEERFSRRKHDGAFPSSAIMDCLRIAGLEPEGVAACVFAEKPLQSLIFDRTGHPTNRFTWWLGSLAWTQRSIYASEARRMMPQADLRFAWHHLSHAAAAFATSPYQRAAFLCVDGKGEDVCATIGVADAFRTEILFELPYEDGIGLLYSLVTNFLGFASFGSEYKVMGLAPYGRPEFAGKLRAFAASDAQGALRLNRPASFQWHSMRVTLGDLARHLGMPARNKDDELTQVHADLAASIQEVFEEEILRMAEYARAETGERNLLFCGGCAQNCVAAGRLRRAGIFESVFNSPVGGDMGSGLGAALLYRQEQASGGQGKIDAMGFYLGSEPGDPPAEAFEYSVPYEGGIHRAVARLLASGHVVGWVRGRMELGARALGARSILADPRVRGMQSAMNLKVKFRESFRPFAPAILAEESGDWFDTAEPSDYMQYTAYLRPEHRIAMPRGLRGLRERLDFERCAVSSVVHVDYSARIQTVREDVHPDFHRLITEFKALAGVPMLINTSFNVSGQPIVRTGAEAWTCFRHTEIDYLVIGDTLFRNPNDRTREDKRAWLAQFEKHS